MSRQTDGYTGCSNRNELGMFYDSMTAHACAAACTSDPECVSVEMRVPTPGTDLDPDPSSRVHLASCAMSSTCTDFRASREKSTSADYTFWYKTPASDVPGYNVNHVENDSCVRRNELEQLVGTATLAECAAACDADTRCVSFEVREEDAAKVTYGSLAKLARCNLSSTCDNAQARSEGNGGMDRPWYLFHKA
jgi:hypothetical protein